MSDGLIGMYLMRCGIVVKTIKDRVGRVWFYIVGISSLTDMCCSRRLSYFNNISLIILKYYSNYLSFPKRAFSQNTEKEHLKLYRLFEGCVQKGT